MPELTKEKLMKQYVKQGYSINFIATINNCSRTTVARKLKEFGIPMRKNTNHWRNKDNDSVL